MSQNVTNKTDVPLALAVWLLHDEYDYVSDPAYISATSLMRPLRHLVLPHRIPKELREDEDLDDYVARALGHSLHDSIEKAWLNKEIRSKSLARLGYAQDVIDQIIVNPTDQQLRMNPDCIPVYLEQRATREIAGRIIGGKYDMVAEGIVHDNKSTSAYTWVYGGRNDEHQLQGSLYKWLNPKKITEDFIRINYIFTDWQKMQAKSNPNYPQRRIQYKDIPLLSNEETEKYILNKLALIQKYWNVPEPEVPFCTDEELWKGDTVYKYYGDANKTDGRATKNFDAKAPALSYWKNDKGGKGIVITVEGVAKRCDYCAAYPICTQRLTF